MAKEKVSREKIIKLAVNIADKEGIDAVSLKEISKQLSVSSPSLYNHIGSLNDLKKEVSNCAMEQLKTILVKSIIGQSGMVAIKAIGGEYLRFAEEHPKLYETIQWMNIMVDEKGESFFTNVVQSVYAICSDLGMDELEASHLIRTMRSLIHGFASISNHNGFSHESSVKSSLDYAIDIFFLGIESRQKQIQKP